MNSKDKKNSIDQEIEANLSSFQKEYDEIKQIEISILQERSSQQNLLIEEKNKRIELLEKLLITENQKNNNQEGNITKEDKSKKWLSKAKIAYTIIAAVLVIILWMINDLSSTVKNGYGYFNKSDFWEGKWSVNSEYLILQRGLEGYNIGVEGDFSKKMTISIGHEGNGEFFGEVIYKELCEMNPMTWGFFLESKGPNFFSFGKTREFYLTFLREGRTIYLATIRGRILANDEKHQIMELEVIENPSSTPFPKKVRLSKHLPSYEEDFKEIMDHCLETSSKSRLEMMKNVEKILKEKVEKQN